MPRRLADFERSHRRALQRRSCRYCDAPLRAVAERELRICAWCNTAVAEQARLEASGGPDAP